VSKFLLANDKANSSRIIIDNRVSMNDKFYRN